MINIGIINKIDSLDFGFSGVMLRGSGLPWDLRVIEAYDSYNFFDFSIPVGQFGDSYDRYLIRLEEMRESLHIMSQCLVFLHSLKYTASSFIINDFKLTTPSRAFMKYSMNL